MEKPKVQKEKPPLKDRLNALLDMREKVKERYMKEGEPSDAEYLRKIDERIIQLIEEQYPNVEDAPRRIKDIVRHIPIQRVEEPRAKEVKKKGKVEKLSFLERTLYYLTRFPYVDRYLYRRRCKIQERKKRELEKKWGEDVISVVFHSHSAGAGNGYKGSDGAFSLEEIARNLESSPIDAVYITDHDTDTDNIKLLQPFIRRSNRINRVKMFTGVEISSREGHILILPHDKPIEETPRPKISAVDIAEWAFKRGYDIMIPHPDRTEKSLHAKAKHRAGLDIAIGREVIGKIIQLAEEYDRKIYIATRNATTQTDYKKILEGLDEKNRVIWIPESDFHILCDAPFAVVHFKKSDVTDPETGEISAARIHDTLRRWHEGKAEVVPYVSDDKFRWYDAMFVGLSRIKEYFRLLSYWVPAAIKGEVYQSTN